MSMPKQPATRHPSRALEKTTTKRIHLLRRKKTTTTMAHLRSLPFHAVEGEAEDLEDRRNHTSTRPTLATMGASPARLSNGREDDRLDQVAEGSEGEGRARLQRRLMSCSREPSTTW
jgi:hypothetical protein